jgi:hypothetical protein
MMPILSAANVDIFMVRLFNEQRKIPRKYLILLIKNPSVIRRDFQMLLNIQHSILCMNKMIRKYGGRVGGVDKKLSIAIEQILNGKLPSDQLFYDKHLILYAVSVRETVKYTNRTPNKIEYQNITNFINSLISYAKHTLRMENFKQPMIIKDKLIVAHLETGAPYDMHQSLNWLCMIAFYIIENIAGTYGDEYIIAGSCPQ